MKRLVLSAAAGAAVVLVSNVASAGEFDEIGRYSAAEDATFFEPFEEPVRYVPEDEPPECAAPSFTLIEDEATALEGDSYISLLNQGDCAERFVVTVPDGQGAYSASIWLRHGSAGARFIVKYPDEIGGEQLTARLAPTGRATSDGWIELASNSLPIDMSKDPKVYVRLTDFASVEGVDFDALEIVASGEYRDTPECEGVRNPICGKDSLCLGGRCQLGELSVPPLPVDGLRDEMVDTFESKLQLFGGRYTRLNYLPNALETLEKIRDAESAWEFWNGWATAIHQLHDWHTNANGALFETVSAGRLNACFIEGDANLSQQVIPSDPRYKDILVSHVGTSGTGGLEPGDRLVAVDGLHPVEWARRLEDVNWNYHVACDEASFADFAEGMRGLITTFAKTISVIKCDVATMSCNDVVETFAVKDLELMGEGQGVSCDNRPSYHLGGNSPGDNHRVGYNFYRGAIDGTTPEEAIFGMVWDTLYGGGDPNGFVNGSIKSAITDWKAGARGVILDHRAGNGGTLDAPSLLTTLTRPEMVMAVFPSAILAAGFDGPKDVNDGLELFQRLSPFIPYTVGAADYNPELPVALVLHRDGSASDYLPLGMKGGPKTKLFGPGPTAGAFSTFMQFSYWGGISWQFATGDTYTFAGEASIGHGVIPDFVVQQKQSDLMQGIDTIHEAALAWVRQELKP